MEYFKTGFVDINVHALTDKDKLAVSKKIGYILGIRHNCFEEKELNEHYHILENKKESVFIYFEEDLSKFKEFKKHMKGKKRSDVFLRRRDKEAVWDRRKRF